MYYIDKENKIWKIEVVEPWAAVMLLTLGLKENLLDYLARHGSIMMYEHKGA